MEFNLIREGILEFRQNYIIIIIIIIIYRK